MKRRPNTRHREAPAPESRLLVVVAAISLGVGLMAFAMGMRYGLGQNESAGAVEAGGALQQLDRRGEQWREVRSRERSALSFHETLTSPLKPAVALKSAGPPATPPTPIKAKGENAGPAVEPQIAEPQIAEPQITEPQIAEPQITEPQSAAPTATDHLPPPPIVTVPPDAGRFSLQAGAFPDEAVAKALAARLDSRGYQVHIVPAQVEGKGSWYRVRVGSYGDRSAAESERSKLSGEGVFAIVVTEN